MKRKQMMIGLLASSILLSCSSGEETTDAVESSDSTATEVANDESVKEFENVGEIAKNNAFTADQFNWITTFLYGREVTLTGFPNAYSADTEVEFKPNSTYMLDAEDNSVNNTDIKIKFGSETESKMMTKGEKFAVQGKIRIEYKIDENWGNKTVIDLYDAKFVELEQEQTISSIADIDAAKPIFSADLYKVMHDHFEMIYAKPSIQITGEYLQTNTSTTSDGTYYDVRLGPEPVSCMVVEDPVGANLAERRTAGEQITITGKFAGNRTTPIIDQGVIK